MFISTKIAAIFIRCNVLFCVIGIAICCSNASAQQEWESLGKGLDGTAYVLYPDTVNDVLYVGGKFRHANGIKVNGIAQWNGTEWDSLGAGFRWNDGSSPAQIATIHAHNNYLYAGGILDSSGTIATNFVARWDGTSWDSVGKGLNSTVFNIDVFENELYAMGQFYKSDTTFILGVAKWNEPNWETVGSANDWVGWSSPIQVKSSITFKGEFYIGGMFENVPINMKKIARWDGTDWQTIPNNTFGDYSWIRTMAEYQGDLYVAGFFSMFEDTKIDNIARWDGSRFQDVNGGTNAEIKKIIVYQNNLIVVGGFSTTRTISVSRMAIWNGQYWCALETTFSPLYYINDVVEFRGDLYIAGWIVSIDGDTVNHVARLKTGIQLGVCDSLTSIPLKPNIHEQADVKIVPNPISQTAEIIFSPGFKSNKEINFRLYGINGKMLRNEDYRFSQNLEFNRNDLPPGVYYYIIASKENKPLAGKIVIQ